MLKAELGFEQNIKVVELFKFHNFHEEKFFKFQTDFEITMDLKYCAGNRKIPAQDF